MAKKKAQAKKTTKKKRSKKGKEKTPVVSESVKEKWQLNDWVDHLGFIGVCSKCNGLIKPGGNCVDSGEGMRHRSCPKSIVTAVLQDLAKENEFMEAELKRLGCDATADSD